MKLSRKVPARTKTISFIWCKKDFMVMNQKYRDCRSRMRDPMDKCFWCAHEFKDGEMMGLAQPEKGKNKMLCQACATTIIGLDDNFKRIVKP